MSNPLWIGTYCMHCRCPRTFVWTGRKWACVACAGPLMPKPVEIRKRRQVAARKATVKRGR